MGWRDRTYVKDDGVKHVPTEFDRIMGTIFIIICVLVIGVSTMILIYFTEFLLKHFSGCYHLDFL